jgi:peptide/nickel transport system permease protein
MTAGVADLLVQGGGRIEEPSSGAVDGSFYAARSSRGLFWRRFRSDRFALVSLGFVVLLLCVAIAAPLIVKLAGVPGPNVQNLNATDAFGSPLGPSAAHPFATLIGTVVGLVAGFYGGWVDMLLSRAVDVVLSFPVLLLGIGLGAACGVRGCVKGLIQPGLPTIIAIVALVNWTYIARIVRGQVLSLREQEFVQAARSLGASNSRILRREILPNLLAPLIVYSSLLIPQNILLEAALSYLGVGVRAPTASWGQMLADATPIFNTAWWYMAFPGLALLLTVLAFNLLGDGLQDALNPRAGSA